MFNKGQIYRHSTAKDLCIKVFDLFDQDDAWTLNIIYVTQKSKKYHGNEYISINKSDEKYWSLVAEQ